MKKFVYVENGNATSTLIPSDGADLEDGICFFQVNPDMPDDEIFLRSYWKNGERRSRNERPSVYHEWDLSSESWLPDLDAAREYQRQAWNTWRDRELIAGYTHNGHVFHSDDRVIAELQLILKGYEQGYVTGTSAIRTRDNAVLQMTRAEIEGLLLMIGLHRQAIYQQSWVGKDALAGLTTLEDIVAGGPPS